MNAVAENKEVEDDDFEVEIEGQDDIQVELVDDTPEEDRERPRRPEGVEPDIPDDDEISTYTEGVQKRLKKMRWEFHEERRAKEEAARLQEEAVKYAQKIKEENDRLRKSLESSEDTLLSQAKSRIGAQLAQAKANYKAAYESGDPDALLEAQSELSRLQNEEYRIANYKPQRAPEPEPAPTIQKQAPQVAQPPREALEWADRNPWFGKDKRMTGFAYGVHEDIVTKGVAPNTEEYYNQIDAAMKQAFPDKFGVVAEEPAPQQRQAGNVVAPASRTSKKPRTVRLTPSAAALAKRLGLSPEQYAAQLMKDS